MIERIWHGWTRPDDADEYERVLRERILPGVVDGVAGCHGARVLRRDGDGDEEGEKNGEAEVEFVTVIRFASREAVREFAGDDPAAAHVPPEARALLSRFDDRVTHYDLRAELTD